MARQVKKHMNNLVMVEMMEKKIKRRILIGE